MTQRLHVDKGYPVALAHGRARSVLCGARCRRVEASRLRGRGTGARRRPSGRRRGGDTSRTVCFCTESSGAVSQVAWRGLARWLSSPLSSRQGLQLFIKGWVRLVTRGRYEGGRDGQEQAAKNAKSVERQTSQDGAFAVVRCREPDARRLGPPRGPVLLRRATVGIARRPLRNPRGSITRRGGNVPRCFASHDGRKASGDGHRATPMRLSGDATRRAALARRRTAGGVTMPSVSSHDAVCHVRRSYGPRAARCHGMPWW